MVAECLGLGYRWHMPHHVIHGDEHSLKMMLFCVGLIDE